MNSGRRQPLIIGHRGASAVAPENTLIAFERAIDVGADGVEFDVQLARDGEAVVIHDSSLRRTGLRAGAISKLTANELSTIDVGSWFNKRFPRRAFDSYSNATVPPLAAVLELLRDSHALLYIELKCVAGNESALAQEVSRQVSSARLYNRTIVVSFALNAIREIKRIDPAVQTGALFEPRLWAPFPKRRMIVDHAMGCGANQILWHRSLVNGSAIDLAAENDLRSVVWTADHPSWIQRAQRLGIHAIIANNPQRLITEREKTIAYKTNPS